jgi:type II secretory pathway pseudopilin PulG
MFVATKNMRVIAPFALALGAALVPTTANAQSAANSTEARINQLEAVNQALIDYLRAKNKDPETEALIVNLDRLKTPKPVPETSPPAKAGSARVATEAATPGASSVGVVTTNSAYSYTMLDHTENVNTRPLVLLQARALDQLTSTLTLGGGITAIADWQSSNRNSKFAYLMRHPTSANQIGEHVSEAVIHSAQLQATIAFSSDISGYMELLYNPEQSFGPGTITDINRNQIELRKAFMLWGNLKESPYYGTIGKFDIPFGLNDTVSPFTNSTNWHAFAGLAYGAQLGYFGNGIHIRGMAVQGGAQFRSANAPVNGTSVPSQLNNFALDANHTSTFGGAANLKLGVSYQHATAYCQSYPVVHFQPCQDNVPAWAGYGKLSFNRLTLLAEIAKTTKTWPGTHVPNQANPLSVYAASEVTSMTFGGRYAAPVIPNDLNLSFEFSQFRAGPNGSPWERQNQWVAGISNYVLPNVNVFGEYILTQGYAPLNFISGGNFPNGSTWSDANARSNIVMLGVKAAF